MTSFVVCSHCNDGYIKCPACRGGRAPVICTGCDGEGLWYDAEAGKARQCNQCEGAGDVDPDFCGSCDGLKTIECDHCYGTGEVRLADGKRAF